MEYVKNFCFGLVVGFLISKLVIAVMEARALRRSP